MQLGIVDDVLVGRGGGGFYRQHAMMDSISSLKTIEEPHAPLRHVFLLPAYIEPLVFPRMN